MITIPSRPICSSALIFVAILLHSVSGFARDGGGNGVRGGGTGIYCHDRPLILVDEAVALDDRLEPELLDRIEILERLQTRFARYPDLVRTISNRLLAHGPAEHWPRRLGFIPRVDATFDSLYGGYLPRDCRLINVAGFERNQPGSVPALEAAAFLELSPARYPTLELHEAAFSVGVDTYGHANAVLAQKIVGAILAREIDPAELDRRAKLFVAPERFHAGEMNGMIPLVSGIPEFCPASLLFERTGGYGTQMSYVEKSRYVSRRLWPHPHTTQFVRALASGRAQPLVFGGVSCFYRRAVWNLAMNTEARAALYSLISPYGQ